MPSGPHQPQQHDARGSPQHASKAYNNPQTLSQNRGHVQGRVKTVGVGSAGKDPGLLATADEDEAVPKFGEAVKLFCISAKLL